MLCVIILWVSSKRGEIEESLINFFFFFLFRSELRMVMHLFKIKFNVFKEANVCVKYSYYLIGFFKARRS